MNILVTNDDGINAEGIRHLARELSQVAQIYLVAPASQKSGASHSITMHEKLHLSEVYIEGVEKAYSLTGTPADCVKMGLAILKKKGVEIDMIFSGINHGGNLGTDTLYSGTVGAAREGLLNGKMSVALSVNSHEPTHFDYTCKLAKEIAISFKENLEKEDVSYMLNINTPNEAEDKIKGLKLTKLGIRHYEEWFNPIEREDGRIEISYAGNPITKGSMDYDSKDIEDVVVIDMGYATLTPLKHDLTCVKTMNSNIWGKYDEKFVD